MKTAISLPDRLFQEAEAAAKALRLSRSELIRTALEEFLQRRRDAEVTDSLNRYIDKYGSDLSEEDEAWLAHGRATVRQMLEEEEAGYLARRTRGNRRQP